MKLAEAPQEEFLDDVLTGLRRFPKRLSPKYFYDSQGSALFEKICELKEYYLTRTEFQILSENADEIASWVKDCPTMVEFGSGASAKVRLLLNALPDLKKYVPIDISRDFLYASAKRLQREFGHLHVVPVHADMLRLDAVELPADEGKRVGFFPGSTIGNLTPPEAEAFLARARRLLGRGGKLLVGVDLVKDPQVLEAAYNDQDGVTGQFNLNVLERLNRELGANIDLKNFRHKAFFNAQQSRVEMHLVSFDEQEVRVGGEVIRFSREETIHTENSYKYELEDFKALARRSGFETAEQWTDERSYFAVILLIDSEQEFPF